MTRFGVACRVDNMSNIIVKAIISFKTDWHPAREVQRPVGIGQNFGSGPCQRPYPDLVQPTFKRSGHAGGQSRDIEDVRIIRGG